MTGAAGEPAATLWLSAKVRPMGPNAIARCGGGAQRPADALREG